MKINIALGMTPSWFEYSRVTIASVLANASGEDEYCFYILSNCFTEIDKDEFKNLSKIRDAEFNFVLIDDSYFDGAIHDHLGVSSSYRLRLPSLIDESKILYLDSDIIARKDIAELYKTDISNYYLAAVEDKFSRVMRKRIKTGEDEYFYNGGVQLINLIAYRENELEKIMMEKLRASNFYTDQDVVNDVCNGKILKLPIEFNLMPLRKAYIGSEKELMEAYENPTLVHFVGKPWKNAKGDFVIDWLKYKSLVGKIK